MYLVDKRLRMIFTLFVQFPLSRNAIEVFYMTAASLCYYLCL